jgi:predicted phage-related endonuclease
MSIEPNWWITVVEAPIVAALFHMIHGLRRDLQERIERSDQRENDVVNRTRDALADFKLEVARTYVPLSLIREVDRRLSQHLLRIEEKLEEMKRVNARPLRLRERDTEEDEP